MIIELSPEAKDFAEKKNFKSLTISMVLGGG